MAESQGQQLPLCSPTPPKPTQTTTNENPNKKWKQQPSKQKIHTLHLSTMIIPVSAWAFIPPQAETLTEVRKEILTFHHEGFFWRCWFFGEGHPETIWTFWYSEYDATAPYPQHSLTVWIASKHKKGPQGWGDSCLYFIFFHSHSFSIESKLGSPFLCSFFDLDFALRGLFTEMWEPFDTI